MRLSAEGGLFVKAFNEGGLLSGGGGCCYVGATMNEHFGRIEYVFGSGRIARVGTQLPLGVIPRPHVGVSQITGTVRPWNLPGEKSKHKHREHRKHMSC